MRWDRGGTANLILMCLKYFADRGGTAKYCKIDRIILRYRQSDSFDFY